MNLAKIKTKEKAQEILNDERAYNELLKKNKKFFYRLAQTKLKNYPFDKQEILQDLVQEGMISFHKAITKFDPKDDNPTSLSTYAYTIIKNDLIKYLLKEVRKNGYYIKDEEGNKLLKPNISIEESIFKRRFGHTNHKAVYEPDEELFFSNNREKYRSTEEYVIPKIYEEQVLSQLSSLDKTILKLKYQGKSGRQIANEVNMNYHTYKRYLYVVLEKNLKKIKEEE